MRYVSLILFLLLNVCSVLAKSNSILTVEESKVSYLCFLNEMAFTQTTGKPLQSYLPLDSFYTKNVDMKYYQKSDLFKKSCFIANSTYCVDLIACSYQYDLIDGKIEKNKFCGIPLLFRDTFESMLNAFADFSEHVDWNDYNKQCNDSYIHGIIDSLKINEIINWQRELFQTKYNYHLKISKYNMFRPNFSVNGNDLYLVTGLRGSSGKNKETIKMALTIFRLFSHTPLEKYVLSQDRRQIFPYVQMSLAFKFCEEYFPTEFARLRQPPTEHPYYMGGGVFNSHKFHRFYDSFDSFFKNQKLSVAGLKEFLAKYVANENSKIFAMADGDSSTLQKDSIRIDIVTEFTGILYSYKGDKCFAQPFEYSSKVDKNGQNIRHCKIKKVIAQSSDFLSFKVSDEFTIKDNSELNFRFQRGGKKCSYQLKLKTLTEEEVRMEM